MRLVYSSAYERLKIGNEIDPGFENLADNCNNEQLILIRSLLLPRFNRKDIIQAIEIINKIIDNLPANHRLIIYNSDGANVIRKIELC
jgi:uncharacterized protein Yka (UPF0111/DUF47 family)